MDIQVDARGEVCPKPVIMTKKALDNEENMVVTTIVDNEVAKDNISKLAKSKGFNFTVDQTENDDYYIHIVKSEESTSDQVCIPDSFKDLTIAIGSDKMGQGEDELGNILMKSFIYTVKETTPYPRTIALFNSGVKLACKDGQILEDLKAIEKAGVEIIVCGTCLDYYEIKDKIKVGEVANMYSIYESMKNANNTINLG